MAIKRINFCTDGLCRGDLAEIGSIMIDGDSVIVSLSKLPVPNVNWIGEEATIFI
ncbi:hypothetical protein [Bacteroides caecimuris]|uniref:hypothetical protein n=1 Tax=Bacteroides caecimuris TaxID=1796613 RepID=UPI0025722777|nr:hypothetical protein [Bacteroides caecimuris]